MTPAPRVSRREMGLIVVCFALLIVVMVVLWLHQRDGARRDGEIARLGQLVTELGGDPSPDAPRPTVIVTVVPFPSAVTVPHRPGQQQRQSPVPQPRHSPNPSPTRSPRPSPRPSPTFSPTPTPSPSCLLPPIVCFLRGLNASRTPQH